MRKGRSLMTRLCISLSLCLFAAGPRDASAGSPRDIVFECPCAAEWVSDAGRDSGTLTLHFGIRSHRMTRSADVRIAWGADGEAAGFVGPVAAGEVLSGLRTDISSDTLPPTRDSIALRLEEDAGRGVGYRDHEILTLWPVPDESTAGSARFIDMLTDSDDDGVGDVNERIAGTDPFDSASKPGDTTTIDVLWIYDVPTTYEVPFTEFHHRLTVADSMFVDSGTGIRLRGVGVVFWDGGPGRPDSEWVANELARHGADVAVDACGSCGASAYLNGARRRGAWTYAGGAFVAAGASATVLAHELGHVFGLAHSAPQGETSGAFRWSRGHYPGYDRSDQYGTYAWATIMAYGHGRTAFSSPDARCRGMPCGKSADAPDGADAVRSLQLLRFQIASHHHEKQDSDGDGFVDAVDARPHEAGEWFDSDGDGQGDNADTDDDNDGVADVDDVWPLDATEWADVDGDGVGDNADDNIEHFGPFEDPALLAAVQQALGKSASEPVSAEEVATLTRLNAHDKGIRALAGLELAVSLSSLNLSVNDITGIEPLAGLSKLTSLVIYNNQIFDLTPLAGLTALEELDIGDNHVTDLSALSSLKELQNLRSNGNDVADLSPLSALSSLRVLELGRNWIIRDIAPLASLDGLVRLSFGHNRVADLSPLAGLESLNSLELRRNEVTDIRPLQSLRNLSALDVSGNLIRDLTPLARLNLDWLSLELLGISDLAPLSNMDRLSGLALGYNRISDLSPMASLLHRLDWLSLTHNRISDVSALQALREVRHLDLRWNAVSDLGPLTDRSIWTEKGASLDARRGAWQRQSLRGGLLQSGQQHRTGQSPAADQRWNESRQPHGHGD